MVLPHRTTGSISGRVPAAGAGWPWPRVPSPGLSAKQLLHRDKKRLFTRGFHSLVVVLNRYVCTSLTAFPPYVIMQTDKRTR